MVMMLLSLCAITFNTIPPVSLWPPPVASYTCHLYPGTCLSTQPNTTEDGRQISVPDGWDGADRSHAPSHRRAFKFTDYPVKEAVGAGGVVAAGYGHSVAAFVPLSLYFFHRGGASAEAKISQHTTGERERGGR